MKATNWVIYALKKADRVFYVGRSFSMERRLREHRKMFGAGFVHEILESGSGDGFSDAEQKWIAHFLAEDVDLQNKTAGGNGGRWLSDESRKKVSDAFRGRPVTWGHKISAALKGKPRPWTDSGKVAVQATQFKKGQVVPHNTGKAWSDEVKEKISKKVSAGLVGNNRRTGIPHAAADKAKIGAGLRRFVESMSPDERKAYYAARTARVAAKRIQETAR